MVPTILWRRFRAVAKSGRSFLGLPKLPHGSGELLLRQILEMPQVGKEPIDYDSANELFARAYDSYILDDRSTAESVEVFRNQFVNWVSAQGYFIFLTHEEYTTAIVLQ